MCKACRKKGLDCKYQDPESAPLSNLCTTLQPARIRSRYRSQFLRCALEKKNGRRGSRTRRWRRFQDEGVEHDGRTVLSSQALETQHRARDVRDLSHLYSNC